MTAERQAVAVNDILESVKYKIIDVYLTIRFNKAFIVMLMTSYYDSLRIHTQI